MALTRHKQLVLLLTVAAALAVRAQTGPGWALSFNGANPYVAVPDAAALNPASALTVEAWIKTSGNSRLFENRIQVF